MDSCDLVIGKILNYEVTKRNISEITNWKDFR